MKTREKKLAATETFLLLLLTLLLCSMVARVHSPSESGDVAATTRGEAPLTQR